MNMREDLENIIFDIRDGIINTDFTNLNSEDKFAVYTEIINMYEPESSCESSDELFVSQNIKKFILLHKKYVKEANI